MSTSPLIRLHPADNVLVAKSPLALGQHLPEFDVRARAQVPAGHKIAARAIAKGEQVRKYNAVIGVAARDIEAGDYVHSHNLALVDVERDPGFGLDVKPVDYLPEGALEDEEGNCTAGNFVWRPSGSRHVARSRHGALLIAMLLKPNKFLA